MKQILLEQISYLMYIEKKDGRKEGKKREGGRAEGMNRRTKEKWA